MSCILQYAYPTPYREVGAALGKRIEQVLQRSCRAQIKAVLFNKQLDAAGLPKQLVRSERLSVLQAPQNINRGIMSKIKR